MPKLRPGRRPAAEITLDPHYLRAWREFRGMKQIDAAKLAEIDPAALSRIEHLKVAYDQRLLQDLSRIYNVTIPDLLFNDPLRPKPTDGAVTKVRMLDRVDDIKAVEILADAFLSRK